MDGPEFQQLELPLFPDLPHKSLLRLDEVARFFSVSKSTIYRWSEEGKLQATLPSKGVMRIFRVSVLDLMKANLK